MKSGTLKSGTLKSGFLKSGILKSGILKSGTLKSGILKSGTLKSGKEAGGLSILTYIAAVTANALYALITNRTFPRTRRARVHLGMCLVLHRV